MREWQSVLKANPTDWLLMEDAPSVRYFALTQLLDVPATDAVAEEIHAITQMNELIAAATHQQAAVSGEVSQHLGSVQQVAEQNAVDAQELNSESQRLSSLAQRLAGLSARFQVSG